MFDVTNVGLLTAVVAGAISFLSPCVLPLVPGYLSLVSGQTVQEEQGGAPDSWRTLSLALWFVLGFTTVFMLLGATATLLGQFFLQYRREASIIGGALILVFGLVMVGFAPFQGLTRDWRLLNRVSLYGGSPITSYVLGLAFATGWTPCIGPILGVILTMSASATQLNSGLALLGFYSLGLGFPFLLCAWSVNRFLRHRARLRRWGRYLHLGAGVVMITMGALMLTGRMSMMATWILNTFPVFTQLG